MTVPDCKQFPSFPCMQHKITNGALSGGSWVTRWNFEMSSVNVFSILHFAVGNSFDSTVLSVSIVLKQHEGVMTSEAQKNQKVPAGTFVAKSQLLRSCWGFKENGCRLLLFRFSAVLACIYHIL